MAKILIVDDEMQVIQVVSQLLSAFGWSSAFVTRAEL